MSTPALALPVSRVSRHARRRRHALSRVALPWREVPVAASPAFFAHRAGGSRGRRLALAGLLAVLTISAHLAVVWYDQRFSLTGPKPKQTTLALELVRPPKPQPKVEPPPPPPKPRPPRAPPPIQSAVVASDAPIAATVETVAAVAAAEPAPPPPPEPVKAAFGGIGYKNNPAPDYPAQAVRQGWQGTVLLRVKVLPTGSVDSIEVVKSSGKKVLDDAAIHTVERWVFAPSTRGSTPIDGFATVPIEFKLDS